MEIILYRNKSDRRALNKTLENPLTIANALLLNGNDSILSPQLILTGVNVSDYNYAYIADLGRYYFITKIDIVDNQRYRIYCDVDILMSFAADIKNLTVISTHAQSNFNRYLPDSVPVSARRNIIAKEFSNGEINSANVTDTTNCVIINYLAGGAKNG